MASGKPLDQEPGQLAQAFLDAYSALERDALASRIPIALDYYAYVASDPEEGMFELIDKIEDRAPALGELRGRFMGSFLAKKMGDEDQEARIAPEDAANMAEEFDISTLTFVFADGLKTSLQDLTSPGFFTRNLKHGLTMGAKQSQRFDMEGLRGRHPRLYELSTSLGKSALGRVCELATTPQDMSLPAGILLNGLPKDLRDLYGLKRRAQHSFIFTVAKSLDMVNVPAAR